MPAWPEVDVDVLRSNTPKLLLDATMKTTMTMTMTTIKTVTVTITTTWRTAIFLLLDVSQKVEWATCGGLVDVDRLATKGAPEVHTTRRGVKEYPMLFPGVPIEFLSDLKLLFAPVPIAFISGAFGMLEEMALALFRGERGEVGRTCLGDHGADPVALSRKRLQVGLPYGLDLVFVLLPSALLDMRTGVKDFRGFLTDPAECWAVGVGHAVWDIKVVLLGRK
jgi:hypothetical protein